MTDLSKDPLINAVHNGIKRGIRVALENDCLGSAVILILSGIDAMAYIAMSASQDDVTRGDFVRWAEKYITFPCSEQLTGLDLYGALRIPTKSATDSERMRPPLGAERRTLSNVTQSWPTSGFFASRFRIDSPFNVIL